MINQQTFESLILTNTIVAAFCIVLLVTFTIFVILFLVPSLRRRWLVTTKDKQENSLTDVSSFSRQPSFHHLNLNAPRLNPIFESATGTTTTTTTQFGTLFHPHATTATLLHPTVWTSVNPTSIVPTATQSTPIKSATVMPQKSLKNS
ncbi:unnamed protein product [Adineta ricciae]|uniref:Uncharacterized protein n=1 Tax=Adineta ricciae TaxID=249248 RepID=A0A816G9D8_ADIRI|nr:unnamed protein product [Adineta ricciae]